jgi:hypothetical protein
VAQVIGDGRQYLLIQVIQKQITLKGRPTTGAAMSTQTIWIQNQGRIIKEEIIKNFAPQRKTVTQKTHAHVNGSLS